MKFIKKLKKIPRTPPPIPPRSYLVSLLYDKGFDSFPGEVVDAIYSHDRSMRYVILKSDKDFLTYTLQKIEIFDEEEWRYVFSSGGEIPAMWSDCDGCSRSIFDDIESLMRELKGEPCYKQFFM